MHPLDFEQAFNAAADGASLVGFRTPDIALDNRCGVIQPRDGRITVCAYDEWERPEYRQRFGPDDLAKARAFATKRNLIVDVVWFKRED
jgi:crotonobetainyl-CoA:carnitine CoA-transferase CaiB-like acyl-CoA transferase